MLDTYYRKIQDNVSSAIVSQSLLYVYGYVYDKARAALINPPGVLSGVAVW